MRSSLSQPGYFTTRQRVVPADRIDVLDSALELLGKFATTVDVRGRFIALYLGLRLMNGALAPLGPGVGTPASEIEQFLDQMWAKTHRLDPHVVLTAPFGGSTSATAPYSARSGVVAPGHNYPTNTWRNNFAIQKGVGCPAEPATIDSLLLDPNVRLACPHFTTDQNGQYVCEIAGTAYRGEEHSIWLRMADGGGYQVVDLDIQAVWLNYLQPGGQPIPIFPLIAALYCRAPDGVYAARQSVGIRDFAADFGFDLERVAIIFDCNPESRENAAILSQVQGVPITAADRAPYSEGESTAEAPRPAGELPALGPLGEINSGVGAELAVASDLIAQGWEVLYRGNQRGIGYDLEATREGQTLRVEVKSSVSFTAPQLLEAEWNAAQLHSGEYILAVVDFYGSQSQAIWYVRDPAANANPAERTTRIFKIVRADIHPLGTDAEFL